MKSIRRFTKQMVPGQKAPRSRPRRQFVSAVRSWVVEGKYNHLFGEPLSQSMPRLWRSLLTPRLRSRLEAMLKAPHRRKSSRIPEVQGWLLAVLAVVVLTSTIGYRFYSEPQLAVDTIAPQTLRAPGSATVSDSKTTEAKRRAALVTAPPVLKIDQTINQEIYQSMQRLLAEGDALRQQVGAFPFAPTSTLSTSTQSYLRQASDVEWKGAIAAAQANPASKASLPKAIRLGNAATVSGSTNAALQLAVLELQNYRRTVSSEDFTVLKQIVTRARQNYSKATAPLTANPEKYSLFDTAFLNLPDSDWETTKLATRQVLERILVQGIPPGLPDGQMDNAIRTQVTGEVPMSARALATRMLQKAIQPNLVQDPVQTRQRAEQEANAVRTAQVSIRRGETIVSAGEKISQSDFVLLDHFGMSQRQVNLLGLVTFALLVGGGVALFLLVEQRFHPGLRRRDHLLVLLMTMTTPLLAALGVPTTSLPALGLLMGSFYGSALGVTVVLLLSIALPIGIEMNLSMLIASAAGGLLGAVLTGRSRSREELALLGGAVGLTQGIVYFFAGLIATAGVGVVWHNLLVAAVVQGAIGLAWSIVALGISPYLEQVFDLVTSIRLAELANPNRPLLKRLAAEAPGTFQHTLFVATLAEAAARELGCNVELVRAGTLYHDIGKMHDSLGFIENQMGGPNKHDLIDDPWKSAEIIRKHVTEGLAMARRYRLPRRIQAFIPEHQGTMQIAYFYHEALKRAKADPTLIVRESDFRYEGPAPQSRETGIVMLADSCEAALRSLKDATPEEALAMVNRVMRARWQDDQMVDSGLTRADMTCIAEIFVQVWQQFNHQRIAYPKLAPTPQPSAPAA
jgi:putative nucleotidyltransferase with HDIG domain